MFTIRDHQLDALGHHVRAAFQERLAGFVQATLPEVVAGLTGPALGARVAEAEAEAVAFGMCSQRAIARFVALRLWLAREPAALAALRAELASGRGDPETLLHRWLEAAAAEARRAAVPAGEERVQ